MNDTITRWAHQTVIVCHSCSSWDGNGNSVYATSSDHTAIVQRVQKLVRGRDGVEKVASVEIILASTYAIGYDDKLTLPTGEQPLILAIESPVDFDGVTEYYRVYT